MAASWTHIVLFVEIGDRFW